MIRSVAVSLVAVGLCIQIMLLPTRSFTAVSYPKAFPSSQLPTASNGERPTCRHFSEVFSWNPGLGWIDERGNHLAAEELTQVFERLVSVTGELGYMPNIRVRVPADAPAKPFVKLAMQAEDAGVEGLILAVRSEDWW